MTDEYDIKISALKELLEAKIEALEQARVLQANEYARRLENLNGEAARLKEMQSTYMPRETYDARHEELVNRIRCLEAFKDNLSGKIAIISIASSLIISIVITLIIWVITGR